MNFVEDTPEARFVTISARVSLLGPLGAAICCIGLAVGPSLLSTIVQVFGWINIVGGLGAGVASLVVGWRVDLQSSRVLTWLAVIVTVLFIVAWIGVRALMHLYTGTGLTPS